MKPIDIFDIDGTLIKYFGDQPDTLGLNTYDLWENTTTDLTSDKSLFAARYAFWKESIANGTDPMQASYHMMQEGINILPDDITANDIFNKAKEIALTFCDHHILHHQAISYIKHRINSGVLCILATANYIEAAHGLVSALVEKKLLTADEQVKLLITGSDIDWANKKINFMNMAENKVIGIQKLLATLPEYSIDNVHYAFGDDPVLNDSGILRLAKKQGFVIPHNKNKLLCIQHPLTVKSWQEICELIITNK